MAVFINYLTATALAHTDKKSKTIGFSFALHSGIEHVYKALAIMELDQSVLDPTRDAVSGMNQGSYPQCTWPLKRKSDSRPRRKEKRLSQQRDRVKTCSKNLNNILSLRFECEPLDIV
jgi:hypothetical protein